MLIAELTKEAIRLNCLFFLSCKNNRIYEQSFTVSYPICIPDRIFRVVQVFLMKFTFLGSYFVLLRSNNCPSLACEKCLAVGVTKYKCIRARSAVKRICRFRNEISSSFFCRGKKQNTARAEPTNKNSSPVLSINA